MNKDDIILAAKVMAARIGRMKGDELDAMVDLLQDLKRARQEEDVEAIRQIPGVLAELMAPEIIGEIRQIDPENPRMG